MQVVAFFWWARVDQITCGESVWQVTNSSVLRCPTNQMNLAKVGK